MTPRRDPKGQRAQRTAGAAAGWRAWTRTWTSSPELRFVVRFAVAMASVGVAWLLLVPWNAWLTTATLRAVSWTSTATGLPATHDSLGILYLPGLRPAFSVT